MIANIVLPWNSFNGHRSVFTHNQMIAVKRKGPLEGLNVPFFELEEIQIEFWFHCAQNRRYMTEMIDKLKITLHNLNKLARAKFRNI